MPACLTVRHGLTLCNEVRRAIAQTLALLPMMPICRVLVRK